MKFLLVVSILATSAAFANVNDHKIKCYYPAQQDGQGTIAYVLEKNGQSLHVAYPDGFPGAVRLDGDCLENSGGGILTDPKGKVEFCIGTGQEINRLVPIEATVEGETTETVYCQKSILDEFLE